MSEKFVHQLCRDDEHVWCLGMFTGCWCNCHDRRVGVKKIGPQD